MQGLTEAGTQMVSAMAARHNVSTDAVYHLLMALSAGGGTQAQFNHPELGGMGQWSQGGMIMVGDMFNQSLKYRVDALCNDLAGSMAAAWPFAPAPMAAQGGFAPVGRWPAELGAPSSSGSQNDMAYAVFPATRRLAIERYGLVTVYDTGDHQIGGVSQQQSGDQSLTFTSQYGLVRLYDLPIVSGAAQAEVAEFVPAPEYPAAQPVSFAAEPAAVAGDDDIFARIERLAGLHQKGILTDEEFSAKKAELLARL